MNCKD